MEDPAGRCLLASVRTNRDLAGQVAHLFSFTSNDRQRFELSDGEIHVWHLLVDAADAPPQAASCLRLLGEDEIHRSVAFRNDEARCEYLVTRGFVRSMLARYLATDAKALRFRKNQHGRPELWTRDGVHPLRFNLSHSAGLIACALAWQRDIGIDVESLRSVFVEEDIARHHFANGEFEDYRRQPTAETRHVRFLEYWTLKEAYLKARGMGLGVPLDKFSCSWTKPDQVQLTIDPILRDDGTAWQLSLMKLAPNFVSALATRGETARPVRFVARVAKFE